MKRKLIALGVIALMLLSTTMAYAEVRIETGTKVNSPYVRLELHEANLTTGQSLPLKVFYSAYGQSPPFNWKSSNPNVAAVTNRGVIKAKKKGKTTITVYSKGNSDKCVVTVKKFKPYYMNVDKLYKLTNKQRTDYNKKVKKSKRIKKLKRDKKLDKIAKTRAKDLAKMGRLSHYRPNGKKGISLIKGNIYKGENIAMGYKTQADVAKALYKSKSHRKNTLKNKYTRIGVAGYRADNRNWWVIVFASDK